MKELNDIIAAYDKAVLQNKKMALVTVVKVEGSSYRRPGARMLVTEDGEITGAISGGCLEGDALRKAQLAMFQQQNKLEIYDTTDDEDNRLGVQLGCNGIVYILFEPIKNHDVNNPVSLLKMVSVNRKDAVVATIFNEDKFAPQQGTCFFINDEQVLTLLDATSIKAQAKKILEHKISVVKEDNGHSILFQFIPPCIQIVIVGAGNDAQPLADMASLLGWNIVVVDGRPSYANRQRFPKAKNLCVLKASEFLQAVTIDEHTAVVLMTHNYNYDVNVLEQVIQVNCKYIGMLGPKKKLDRMLLELTEKGIKTEAETIHRIYGPVGLDIGAETSEEIAISIVAEIKAVFTKRNGASLRERNTGIHERSKISHHG
jgi:xanthine dehydrogenase accessory factor